MIIGKIKKVAVAVPVEKKLPELRRGKNSEIIIKKNGKDINFESKFKLFL